MLSKLIKELSKVCGLSEREIMKKWKQAEISVRAIHGITEEDDEYYPFVYRTFKTILSSSKLLNSTESVRDVLLNEAVLNEDKSNPSIINGRV